MTTPAAPSIVALNAIWQSANENVENTYHYHVAGTIDTAKLTAMANTYKDWVAAHVILFATQAAFIKVYLEDLTSSSSASLEYNPPAVIDGTDDGNILPNNVSFSIKRMTGLRGRANRGRIYWIALTEASLDSSGQQITKPRADVRVTACNDLLAAQFSANAAQEVIYHKALGTGTAVTSYTYADLFLDSQRRRLPMHNRHR